MERLESRESLAAVEDVVTEESTVVPEPSEALDFKGELADLLERRDFRTLLGLAEENRIAIDANPDLTAIVMAASERLEAEPYARTFIDAAEKAQREGRDDEAHSLLEKARALDPSHPSLPPAMMPTETSEGNERIRELLEEGQRALLRGDHQGAIDSWSRIFLIDIDHAEAGQRIEEARRLRAENERQIEEAFHEAVSLWELGTTDKAREQFERVLGINPSHVGAKDYLERMDAQAAAESSGFEGAPQSGDAEVFTPPDSLSYARKRATKRQEAEPTVSPATETRVEVETVEPAARPKPKPRRALLANRRFLSIAGLAVLVLVVALAALYVKRDVFFPNSNDEPEVAQVDALVRARKLQAVGQTAMAIAQLTHLQTDHPQYAEAQALVAQWQAPAAVAEEPTGPSDEDLARRDALVAQAQQARQNREYLRTSVYYERAAKIAPLAEQDLLLQTEVEQRLAGLEKQIELYKQGDWEFALPELWRLHSANPDDKDVVRLMVDSYYNLGVRDLQRGDPPAAVDKLERAIELDPADNGVEHLLDFGRTYADRPADLLYRIFVKYLPFR
jgi:tetratricopeptide (TPR) repeat protein